MQQQRFTQRDTAVIAKAQRLRRPVLVLSEDKDWLGEYSSRPKDLLRAMAGRGALIELGAGRYALPRLGLEGIAYLEWQPLLDARLKPLGSYYLGFFSALEGHRLTDLEEPVATVLVGFPHRQLAAGQVEIAGRPVRSATTQRDVFSDDLGVETVRPSRIASFRRSNPTRTLVDCTWHPELASATETWVSAWGRAAARGVLDPVAACTYAQALGPAVARRVGVMLDLAGHGDVARAGFSSRVRRSDRESLLVANGPPASEAMELDSYWRVRMNVERDRLEGWLLYGK
jgi:predicted transcriptional regulator of viral defense system